MKNKTAIILVILFLLTACSGTSSLSDSPNIDFNADVALIAQGVEKFDKISADATSVENDFQYSALVTETNQVLDEISIAVDIFAKHINNAREFLPTSDSSESPSFNKLLAWANGYKQWVYYQRLNQSMGEECLTSNLGFKGCLLVNLPETLENERLGRVDLQNAIAGIQEWRSSLGYN